MNCALIWEMGLWGNIAEMKTPANIPEIPSLIRYDKNNEFRFFIAPQESPGLFVRWVIRDVFNICFVYSSLIINSFQSIY